MLLTGMFRQRCQGVIRLWPTDGSSRPQIEFQGGEGPAQVMDRIQDSAVPLIRKAVEPLGPYLRWEEFDPQTGVVVRRRSSFRDCLSFVVGRDEGGIELVLSRNGDAASQGRPWVPLRPLGEPGPRERATLGWSVEPPRFSWRYLKPRYGPLTMEMTWSCPSLPRSWAAQVLKHLALLSCTFDEGKTCPLHASRDGLLVYRGYYPLRAHERRPGCRWISLEQPLVVLGPEDPSRLAGTGVEEPGDRHGYHAEVPATVEALDFRALVGDRVTRLVEDADLGQPFVAEVLTAEGIALPTRIPAGRISGLPWELGVGPQEERSWDESAVEDEGRNLNRWVLTPRPRGHEKGTWQEVGWEGEPPTLRFGLGSFDPGRAPGVTQVEDRRARVGWRIEASEDQELLGLTVPHWVPAGCPEQVALPLLHRDGGFDYASEVRGDLGGIEERFTIDESSEVSSNRIFLGPRRWRFRDELHGELSGGEALGEVSGCVRWRRPRSHDSGSGSPAASPGPNGSRSSDRAPSREAARLQSMSPTQWAGGSAPVLLVGEQGQDVLHWGGLYAPESVPWDALEEVFPEPVTDPRKLLLVSRSSQPAIWIDLWGFVCRYDRHPVLFTQSRDEKDEVIAWVARPGLELFPRRRGFLLRSFAPLYAVRDEEPRAFRLLPTAPRPTLRIGAGLDREAGFRLLEVGPETYVRCEFAAPDEPPAIFGPGRVPGTGLRLGSRFGGRVAWFAVEQEREGKVWQTGYLLSWDVACGWRFRGFFARPGAPVELGTVRQAGVSRRVFLGDETCTLTRAFRLTIDALGERWSASTPEPIPERVTRASIREWEREYFVPSRRPEPLQDYEVRVLRQPEEQEVWVFEFFECDRRDESRCPPGIRVWELLGEAYPGLLESEVRTLGEEEATEEAVESPWAGAAASASQAGPGSGDRAEPQPEAPARAPELPAGASLARAPKRILRADDDDDF